VGTTVGAFYHTFYVISIAKNIGKAFPLQDWTGPWGSQRLRLQNF
jgi:hypothetical protein